MAKITLIGAGSIQFGLGTVSDIFQTPSLKGSHISLLDINETAVKKVQKLVQDHIDTHKLDFTVDATLDRKAALKDADFVIISIEVGDRFALWDQDWNIPQQYGIRQVYGENGGAGGLFHALRIIPPILDICDDIAAICPDAWIFNYSNPMSRICTTVSRKYPDLKFIGMCHEIASLYRYLPKLLDTDLDNIDFYAAGLNHFSVLLDVKYKDTGHDAYNVVRGNAEKVFGSCVGYSDLWKLYQETGKAADTERFSWDMDETGLTEGSRPWTDRKLFKEVLDRFGYLPITYDSHFGEYISWAYDVSDHQGILDFYTLYRSYLSDAQESPKIDMSHRHERFSYIIEALMGGESYVEAAVNIPNNGAIRNLPDWITVEVPAVISKNSMKAMDVNMPAGIGGLLTNQVGVHDVLADAILQKSKDLVIQALLVDPVVNVAKDIPELVDVMIDRQRPWLDYLK